ncbi:MAG: nucleotidyl transferase AbiEii/AbiGii toxin family protein [Cyclobacteriaceae bacterium]
MLFTETVEPRTFTLLKRLLVITALQPFSLVDGTALSLLYGHRKSVDLDLFATKSFVNP